MEIHLFFVQAKVNIPLGQAAARDPVFLPKVGRDDSSRTKAEAALEIKN